MNPALSNYVNSAPGWAHRTWGMGRHQDKPMFICASLNSRSFGDFVSSLFFLNTVADHFDHRHVTLIYKDDMDFKNDMVRLLPVNTMIRVPAKGVLPSLEMFNYASPVIEPSFEPWFKAGLPRQDLFITQKMAVTGMLWSFDEFNYLRIPDEDVPRCADALVARGLDASRWFCTLHAREPGYQGKPGGRNFRDSDPQTYLKAAIHIIKVLGGQVVRLGHPEAGIFPEMKGLVDLSRERGNALLQAFAISRARFQLSSNSGPQSVADAFHIPNAVVDETDFYAFNNDRMVVRTVDLHTPDGNVLRQEALAAAGIDKMVMMQALKSGQGYRVERNGPEEVIRLVNYVHNRTSDTTGWRTPDPPRTSPRPNQIVWPAMPKPRGEFLPV